MQIVIPVPKYPWKLIMNDVGNNAAITMVNIKKHARVKGTKA